MTLLEHTKLSPPQVLAQKSPPWCSWPFEYTGITASITLEHKEPGARVSSECGVFPCHQSRSSVGSGFFSTLCPQGPVQHLDQSRHSVSKYWMNNLLSLSCPGTVPSRQSILSCWRTRFTRSEVFAVSSHPWCWWGFRYCFGEWFQFWKILGLAEIILPRHTCTPQHIFIRKSLPQILFEDGGPRKLVLVKPFPYFSTLLSLRLHHAHPEPWGRHLQGWLLIRQTRSHKGPEPET